MVISSPFVGDYPGRTLDILNLKFFTLSSPEQENKETISWLVVWEKVEIMEQMVSVCRHQGAADLLIDTRV